MAQSHIIPFKSRRPDFEPGRGARSSESGRFERQRRITVDDGWGVEAELVSERRRTRVLLDNTKTIINRVTSPYVGFDRSINP